MRCMFHIWRILTPCQDKPVSFPMNAVANTRISPLVRLVAAVRALSCLALSCLALSCLNSRSRLDTRLDTCSYRDTQPHTQPKLWQKLVAMFTASTAPKNPAPKNLQNREQTSKTTSRTNINESSFWRYREHRYRVSQEVTAF